MFGEGLKRVDLYVRFRAHTRRSQIYGPLSPVGQGLLCSVDSVCFPVVTSA